MPIYEYACTACGKDTEKLLKLSDPDPVKCSHCGKPKLQRKLSAAGFRLSGSGWYETDFKKDGKRNLAGDSDTSDNSKSGNKATAGNGASGKDKSSSSSETKSESKTESKPAPKSDKKSSAASDSK